MEEYIRLKAEGTLGVAIYYECKLDLLSTFQTMANRLSGSHGHTSPLERMQILRRFLGWVGKKLRLKSTPECTLNPSRDPLSEDGRS